MNTPLRRVDDDRRPDRRRQRTRRLLSDVLTALILENGYDSITIQNITDRANVSRATFYLHFTDKEDLYLWSLQSLYDELVAQLAPLTRDNLMPDGTPPSLIVFRHAAEHRDLYRIMLRSQSSASIVQQVKNYVAGHLRDQMETFAAQHGITQFALPMDVLIEHMASSLMGLVIWWLETDTPHNVEDMARLFQQLNAPAWLYAFGMSTGDVNRTNVPYTDLKKSLGIANDNTA